MESLINSGNVSAAKAACVLLVWAQALLYTGSSETIATIYEQNSRAGQSYYEQASRLLENEPGPATLASIQARIAVCLYLLSTSRVNECRFVFGYTITLVTALGLHRRYASKRLRLNVIEAEGCKRAFWCVYVIDGYLSVMLGRPRSFREEDIDQEYPINIDDPVLQVTTDTSLVPHHGDLEASIFHAKLARVMARNNDALYPLANMNEQQIIEQARISLQLLQAIEDELPPFLRPREKILTGTSTWERQNTVLKLALAHARILATRRCILVDKERLSRTDEQLKDMRAACVRKCLWSTCTIIDLAYEMMQQNGLYQAFWYTQYISLCAISTLFMHRIQQVRSRFMKDLDGLGNIEEHFNKAEEVQQYLAQIAPAGSQAQRHHDLLNHLRNRANNKRPSDRGKLVQQQQQQPPPVQLSDSNNLHHTVANPTPTSDTNAPELSQEAPPPVARVQPWGLTEDMLMQTNHAADPGLPPTIFTPLSSIDFNFPQGPMSWQYLDQLGAFAGGEEVEWF